MYENGNRDDTACAVDTTPKPSVRDTITRQRGTATTTDADVNGSWLHVFRLVH